MPEVIHHTSDDQDSVFEYEEERAQSVSIKLSQLRHAVSEHFGLKCNLVKTAEGGFHKVYDILEENGRSLCAVARVASPAFPRDKMESEVATMKYIAENTLAPVPTVMAWNSDASNPVGAEYMILEKIEGTSPSENWKQLPVEVKEKIVKQVAAHLVSLFSARFEQAGSLYLAAPGTRSSDTSKYAVGPIVSEPFFESLDGLPSYTDMSTATFDEMYMLRGPFKLTSDYLSSSPRARLLYASRHRDAALKEFEEEEEEEEQNDNSAGEQLDRAKEVVDKVIELCRVYPGERVLHEPSTSPGKPFSFLLDDFRLTNIIVDEQTGDVRGLIDFEGTTIAPLWECATVPSWIPDPDGDMRNWYGGSPEDQHRIWTAFHDAVAEADITGEWRRAYVAGEPYRNNMHLGLPGWLMMAETVEARLTWAKNHPGVGMPEEEF